MNVKYCENISRGARLLISVNNLCAGAAEKHQTVPWSICYERGVAQTCSSLSCDDNAKWHASAWYAKAISTRQNMITISEKEEREEGGEGHRERNTERSSTVTSCWMSATEGPLARANYPLPFYYDLNWCTTPMELAGVGTMHETGTRRPDECNWVFRNRDAFTTTRAHLLPHYRLRGENMLSTTVAKYNDGVTAH